MHAQLKSLEQQLDELISLARNLRGENLTLRQKLLLAENEKQKLEKKINLATSKLENMLHLHDEKEQS
jgi:regulator of replication initiation timing